MTSLVEGGVVEVDETFIGGKAYTSIAGVVAAVAAALILAKPRLFARSVARAASWRAFSAQVERNRGAGWRHFASLSPETRSGAATARAAGPFARDRADHPEVAARAQ